MELQVLEWCAGELEMYMNLYPHGLPTCYILQLKMQGARACALRNGKRATAMSKDESAGRWEAHQLSEIDYVKKTAAVSQPLSSFDSRARIP